MTKRRTFGRFPVTPPVGTHHSCKQRGDGRGHKVIDGKIEYSRLTIDISSQGRIQSRPLASLPDTTIPLTTSDSHGDTPSSTTA
jgi:hypothetical protein